MPPYHGINYRNVRDFWHLPFTLACDNSGHLRADLDAIGSGIALAEERLSGLYASSRAPDAWHLLLGMGPLTRAELARILDVTPRTASQVALALEQAGLIESPAPERPLQPVLPRR